LDPLAISPDTLARQLGRLSARGFRGVTLSALADGVDFDAVAITFDDAFASALRAKPLLDDLGWVATVFPVTDTIDDGEPLSLGGSSDPEERRPLTWDDLAGLAESGWEVGSHTRTHRVLSKLSPDELEDELAGSRAIVIDRVGGECRSISYPYGELDDRVLAAARRAGYVAGAGLAGRYRRSNPLAVPRVAVARRDDAPRFAIKTSRPFALFRSTRAWDILDRPRRATRPQTV
jgi:peptidoglycan/xylan/chitin deacetylase (PgdA/CDA1 family)